MGLLENILKGAVSGGQSSGGGLEDILGTLTGGNAGGLGDILKQMAGAGTTTSSQKSTKTNKGGVNIEEEFKKMGIGTQSSSKSNGSIDLSNILGKLTQGGTSAQSGATAGGIDIGSILGQLTGGSGGGLGDIAKSVISVIGMAGSAFGGAK